MSRTCRFDVEFVDMQRRAYSPTVQRIWSRVSATVTLEASLSLPIGAIVEIAVATWRARLAEAILENERSSLADELRKRLEPFAVEPQIDEGTILTWLTEPAAMKCRYRDADGRQYLMPPALGPTNYQVMQFDHAAYRNALLEGEGDVVATAIRRGQDTQQQLWPLDQVKTSVAGHNVESGPILVSVQPHLGINVVLDGTRAAHDRWSLSLLDAWGPLAIGRSRCSELVPWDVWEDLTDDERWTFEDAAGLIVTSLLPAPPWLRTSNLEVAKDAYPPTRANHDLARTEIAAVLGLTGASPLIAEAGVDDSHRPRLQLVRDLERIRERQNSMLYATVKRLLGLLEQRITRHGDDNHRVNRRKISERWRDDVLSLNDAATRDHYAVTESAWNDNVQHRREPSQTLSDIVAATTAALPLPVRVVVPTNTAGDWSEISLIDWYHQLVSVQDNVRTTFRVTSRYPSTLAGKDLPGKLALGALGKLVLDLRNLLEHGGATTTSDLVRVDTRHVGPARQALGLADGIAQTVTLSVRDVESCLRLVTLLFTAWHAYNSRT